MGNSTSWLAQALCPEEQALWVAAKAGDAETLRAGLARLTPETRYYAEWRDPVYGYSPLANACAQGHLACAAALVAAGVDCNARDALGNTPLHIAARAGKSEVVRALLDTLAVDYHARTTSRGQTALDIARHEYQAADGRAHKFVQCIEMIEKKLCLYSGWLYQRADNLLSLASGMPSLNSWKKRYCIVLRTGDPDVVEIDLFPMHPGEKRPPCPSSELVYRASDGIQESSNVTWLSRKDFRFSLLVVAKSGVNRVSAPESVDFAANNNEELLAWKLFFTNLRLHGSSHVQISSAFTTGAPAAARPVVGGQSAEALSQQEQQDLVRALRLSMEESRRQSLGTSALPSAPSLSMVSSEVSPRATIGPDGVEIVQQIGLCAEASAASASASASAPAASASDVDMSAENECVICFDGPQSAVCVPCGHNAICMDCAEEILDTTRLCPVCRQTVREVIKLYRV